MDRLKIVTFKAPESLISDMDAVAMMLGVTRSELIRMAVSSYIAAFRRQGRGFKFVVLTS